MPGFGEMKRPGNTDKVSHLLASLFAPDAHGGGDPESGYLEMLVHLAAGLQYREEGIVEHLRRIAAYVDILAGTLGWPASKVSLLSYASLFHDVGMVDVPEAILKKEGALSDQELEILRKHTGLGRGLLRESGIPLLEMAAQMAESHHERFDGSGYPRGLQGSAIPLSARILSVADVFDALTTRRPFKEPYPFEVAVEIIRTSAEKQFDPEIVDAFIDSRKKISEACTAMATPDVPTRKGFRLSERDRFTGELFSIARSEYFNCPFCQDLHPHSASKCPKTGTFIEEIHKLSGTVIDQKYHLRGTLGVGGMGVVYEAMHRLIGRRLAIKFLKPGVAHDRGSLTRFYNEARVFSRVGHPGLVEVTDMGRTPEGLSYIVMEHLSGVDLARLTRTMGRLPVIAAVTVTLEILRALAAVHAQGIIHRDLKPENIYIVREGGRDRLKIMDFGVSSLLDELKPGERLTEEGFIFGTPQFMSPEQAQGVKKLDQRSDLFSVGALLYETLSGCEAFAGDNPLSVIADVTKGRYRPLKEIVTDLPDEVNAIVELALTVDINLRFQTAGEFARVLLPIASRDPRFKEGMILDLWGSPVPPPAE